MHNIKDIITWDCSRESGQYSTLIPAEGIQPLPEKFESIAKMPAPKNPKEVKKFLGLVGYYRKLVPRFTDISRVLTHVEFKWTPECENFFQILKEFLQQAPILKYPDPHEYYTLYTDASKYAYMGVLTQHCDSTDHPITYISRLFHGSQLNWATLTKETYAIYMSVKKLSFYIDTAKITVKSDHLPLKKFLEKNTLNSKNEQCSYLSTSYVLSTVFLCFSLLYINQIFQAKMY